MAKEISRRDILRGSAAAVVGLTIGRAVAESPEKEPAPNGRLRFGIIGCGGKGWSGMAAAAEHGDIVALADLAAKLRLDTIDAHPTIGDPFVRFAAGTDAGFADIFVYSHESQSFLN